MNQNFKPNERELVKVATFFKKQSKKLIEEGKLGEEHKKVEEAVDKFVAHMEAHADARTSILEQRETLQKLVKDEAECPTCHKRDMLKFSSVETNEKGWKSNRYKCRRCNIEFTWSRPNNPWDMITWIEEMMTTLKARSEDPAMNEAEREHIRNGLVTMSGNLDKLKPVIEAHDKEYRALQAREEEMERLIHEFKNSLLIEKIKMDTWENKNK